MSRGSTHSWAGFVGLPSRGMNGLTAGAQNSNEAKNVAADGDDAEHLGPQGGHVRTGCKK